MDRRNPIMLITRIWMPIVGISLMLVLAPLMMANINFETIPESVIQMALERSARQLILEKKCFHFALKIMKEKREYKRIYEHSHRLKINDFIYEVKILLEHLARREGGVNWARMGHTTTIKLKYLFQKCIPHLKTLLHPQQVHQGPKSRMS